MAETPDSIQPTSPQPESGFTNFLKKFGRKQHPSVPSVPITPSPQVIETAQPQPKGETTEDRIRRELEEQIPIRQECLENIQWLTQLPESYFQEPKEHSKMMLLSDLVHNALLRQARNAGIDASIPPFPFLASKYGEYNIEKAVQATKHASSFQLSPPEPSISLLSAMRQSLGVPNEISYTPPVTGSGFAARNESKIETYLERLTQGGTSAKSIIDFALNQELFTSAYLREKLIAIPVLPEESIEDSQHRVQVMGNRIAKSWGPAKMYTELYKRMEDPNVEQSVTNALIPIIDMPHDGFKA